MYRDLDVRVRKQAAMQIVIDGDELRMLLDALKDYVNQLDLMPFESTDSVDMMALHDKLIAEWKVQTEETEVVA